MKVDVILKYLLLGLIVIYYSQGVFYEQGSSISQIVLFLILGISVLYLCKTILFIKTKPLFVIIWILLLGLNLLVFLFTAQISNSFHYSKLKGLLIITLPFFAFYYLTFIKVLRQKDLILLFYIIFPIFVLQYYNDQANLVLEKERENVVNNSGYLFVYIIPYLFFLKRKVFLSFVFVGIMSILILQASKRGAIITGLIAIGLFMIYRFKNFENKSKFRNYFISLVGIVIVVSYSVKYYLSNQYLLQRFESMVEGDISGRDVIYANIFNGWVESESLFNILFGYGFVATLKMSKINSWAHNDWLEGLACLGVLGVFLYLGLILLLLKLAFTKGYSTHRVLLILSIVIIWILTTIFSMNYYNATNTLFQYAIIAYLFGDIKEQDK